MTLEVAVGQREQAEQPAAEHAVGQRAHRRAVVRDARGVELLVHEPRVRLGRAVEHRHALERHAVAQGVDDEPHDRTHFVVGVGRRHDARRRRQVERRPSGTVEAEAGERGADRRVGARATRESGDDGDGQVVAERGDQPRRRRRQLLGEVHDDGAEVVEQWDRRRDRVDRRRPSGRARRTTRGASAVRARARDAHDVGGASAGTRERVERGVVEGRELAVTRSTSEASVAGCSATGANIPGASASTARTAAASTGVDTGRRCAPASRGAPSSSASR